ncbi:uncharacterized protein SCHCODRAFT_02627750 [Schizophyllum commune H4-8]|nr:uncharacterized protein SCHCODRAFT_02627750 [Schizophyllum commune H4-8]KAI5890960.1 hypothetical protein SCHCODRAFT_02627750 [Schizophyllum commune H4-8]
MSDKRLKDASPAELVRDLALSTSGTAARIEELCVYRVEEAKTKGTDAPASEGDAKDTPGLETFLYELWSEVVKMAQEDDMYHARLLEILAELKKTENAELKKTERNWRVWGAPASLSELSTFGAVARDAFEAPKVELDGKVIRTTPEDAPLFASDARDDADARTLAFTAARQRFLRLHRFLACVWAAGLWPFHDLALWTMRDALEYGPDHSSYKRVPRALKVEAAAQWAVHAGRQMYECKEIMGPKGNANWPANAGAPGRGGDKWDGVDGYDAGRWRLWREEFGRIAESDGELENVRSAAKEAAEAMRKVEEASG